jgi:PIN domain nuclease of toxin-antitoxin system
VVINIATNPSEVDPRLIAHLKQASDRFVTSIARAEIGIKVSIGKLHLPTTENEFWTELVTRLQATELAFESSHAALLAGMPLHHRDPFDRMIAAQCLAEDLTLATTDVVFARYGVRTIS